jgi:spore germination protein
MRLLRVMKTLYEKLLKEDSDIKKNTIETFKSEASEELPTFEHIFKQFDNCSDLRHRRIPYLDVDLLYFNHLVGGDELKRDVLDPLANIKIEELPNLLSQSYFHQVESSKDAVIGVLDGQLALFFKNNVYLVALTNAPGRAVNKSETEAVITGPHDAFVESAEINLALIRKRVKSSHLKVIKLSAGEVTKTYIYLLYIQDIVNEDLLKEIKQRIIDIEIDSITDANMLVQIIDENPNSIFPQYLTTERTDSACAKLVGGRIIGIVDGSPSVLIAPTSFFEFFGSPDDHYQRWALGTFIRSLRFIAFLITIGFTAFYVSVTTYHYEMIPDTLLISLTESRSKVPFPPIYEALLMETTIELLREAGARLPTKIGQTIGIVGGIVIGQAAVQAGLTSNILIIAVASSAIASFVIPSYIMSASIRLIRFGLILLAGIWGNFGLMAGIAIIVVHLSGITNLGTSYLTPVAPISVKDWKDVFIRAPHWMIKERPTLSKSPNKVKNKMEK